MTEWAKIVRWNIDVDQAGGSGCLLQDLSSNARSSTPSMVAGDEFQLRLSFRQRSSSPLTDSVALDLPAGFGIAVSGKVTSGMGLASPLFEALEFTKVEDGDDIYFDGTLDLNTVEVMALFAGVDSNSIPITIDIEVQGDTNAERLTFQVPATLRRQVYDGQAAPTSVTQLGRWKDGSVQIKNITTGLFHTVWLEGASGAGEFRFGEGEA